MLANVRFFSKIFLFLIILFPENLYPYEKEQIIIRLKPKLFDLLLINQLITKMKGFVFWYSLENLNVIIMMTMKRN